MADDEPEDCGHSEEEHERMRAVPIPVPGEFLEMLASPDERDRRRMQGEELRQRVTNFLDTATAEQLLALRVILNMGRGDAAGLSNEFFDGQIVTILRVVHQVNPDTGKSYADELLEPSQVDAPPQA